jgi:hypothetical protein
LQVGLVVYNEIAGPQTHVQIRDTQTHMQTRAYAHIYTQTHTHTHTHTHTCRRPCRGGQRRRWWD